MCFDNQKCLFTSIGFSIIKTRTKHQILLHWAAHTKTIRMNKQPCSPAETCKLDFMMFLLLGQISVISFVNFSRFSWCGMLCSLWWQMFANFSLNLQHKLLILVFDWLTRLLCGHGNWVAHFRGAGRAQTFSADSDQTTMSWSKSSVGRTHFYVHH